LSYLIIASLMHKSGEIDSPRRLFGALVPVS
jgi:hypothetical protein